MDYSNLRIIMAKRNLTVRTFLRESGICTGTFYAMEKGRCVTDGTINKICKCLRVQPGDIMSLDGSGNLYYIIDAKDITRADSSEDLLKSVRETQPVRLSKEERTRLLKRK